MVRYEKFFLVEPQCVAPTLVAFLDQRGMRNADPKVRSRAAYLFSRFVRAVKWVFFCGHSSIFMVFGACDRSFTNLPAFYEAVDWFVQFILFLDQCRRYSIWKCKLSHNRIWFRNHWPMSLFQSNGIIGYFSQNWFWCVLLTLIYYLGSSISWKEAS